MMSWREWKAWAGKIAAALAATGLAFSPAAAWQPVAAEAQVTEARPAMWRISDEDTTIHLFGTIHALPENIDWRTPAIEQAMADATEMVMEVTPPDDPMAVAGMLGTMGMQPGLPPVLERVPEDKRERLRAMIDASGIPAQAYDAMKSWAAAMMLLTVSFRNMGVEAGEGVEQQLSAPWRERGLTITGLETIEEQLGFFDGLSEEAQRLVLASATEDPELARQEFQAMMEAWRTGDTDAIAMTFDSEANLSAELREILMTRRNARWAEWLAERMEQPGAVFVAVGAGHLAGENSVQAMLEEKGIIASRVQ